MESEYYKVILILLFIVMAALFYIYIIAPNKYNEGWNAAIDAIPKAIVFDNNGIANNIPLDEMLQYAPGKPFFVLNQKSVGWSYKGEIIGQTLSLYKIIPKKKN